MKKKEKTARTFGPLPSQEARLSPRASVSSTKKEDGARRDPAGEPPKEQVVPQELAGKKLDGVVRALFGVSWSQARSFVESGKVFLEGVAVTDGERAVRAGSTLALRKNAPRPTRGPSLGRDAVVYVDPHVVVVAKPAGVSTVPFDEDERGTLDELVRSLLERPPYARPGQRGRPTLGVVHRIDKETTGLLVFARTWLAKQSLASQFRFHTVHRRYLALVHGSARAGTIRSHLLADRGDGLRGSRERRPFPGGDEGQLAVTHVEVQERLPGASLVACRLETGRTHQIRIHLSEAGTPLLGERVYVRGFDGPELPAPRLMLHAAELGFVHPATEQPMRFTLPLPADMDAVLTRLRSEA